jgi:hypothetical protein
LILLPRAGLAALLDAPHSAPLPALQLHAVDLGGLPLSSDQRSAADLPRSPRLHFTDLAPRDEHNLWYLAAAEHTTSFYDDGEVAGSALGTIRLREAPEAREAPGAADDGAPGGAPTLRYAPVLDERGALAIDKLEGVCSHDLPGRLWAVTDPDAPDRPGELLELELTGPW